MRLMKDLNKRLHHQNMLLGQIDFIVCVYRNVVFTLKCDILSVSFLNTTILLECHTLLTREKYAMHVKARRYELQRAVSFTKIIREDSKVLITKMAAWFDEANET